ncbi:MAG: MFS transporter [Pseudomonadota bacterium]
MSDPATNHRQVPVLMASSATQFAAGVGFWCFGLLAPELAAVTGLDERDFGLSISFTFAGTFLSSAFTGATARRYGGAGTMARCFAVMAGAILLTLSGTWSGAMLAAFLFGLGYGPQGPLGMTLVTQSADPARRGFFLALRHATVPLAAGITGRLLPPFMIWAGWQAGVLSVAGVMALALVLALLAPPVFAVEAAPARPGGPLRRLTSVFQIPPNLRFLWSAGMTFALTQTAVTVFSYLYLLEVVGVSSVAAGIFASNLHLTALIGRPFLGWLTDRIGSAQVVLAGIALVTVAAIAGLLQVGPDTPAWVLVPLAVACGISGQCWNSVFVTAMSFKVASEDLAELNGRSFAFLSLGWMLAPPIVWALIEVTGGYTVPLIGVAVMNVLVALVLVFASARRRRA